MVIQEVDDNKGLRLEAPPTDPFEPLFPPKPAPEGKWVKVPRRIQYHCQWFAGKKVMEEWFIEEVLMPVKAPSMAAPAPGSP
jgi:hypothetical protein